MKTPSQILNIILLIVVGLLLTVVGSMVGAGFGISIQAAQLVNPVTQLMRKVDVVVGVLGYLQQIQDENQQLKAKLAQMEASQTQDAEMLAENSWLRSQLLIEIERPKSSALAKVLKYEYTPSPGYVFIEVPLTVKAGDWVTSYNYIVGEVVTVSEGVARVRLITAPDTQILVDIDGNVGKLTGTGIKVEVRDLQSSAGVQPGAQIKMAKPNTVYAGRYSLGKVGKVSGTPADTLISADVELAVDVFDLDYMIVIPAIQ